jgi:hypothetical protein
MFPGEPKFLPAVYADATHDPHSYLFIDLRQETTDIMRLRTRILPHEWPTFSYVKPEEIQKGGSIWDKIPAALNIAEKITPWVKRLEPAVNRIEGHFSRALPYAKGLMNIAKRVAFEDDDSPIKQQGGRQSCKRLQRGRKGGWSLFKLPGWIQRGRVIAADIDPMTSHVGSVVSNTVPLINDAKEIFTHLTKSENKHKH